MDTIDQHEDFNKEVTVTSWVTDLASSWRNWYDSNYRDQHDEYYRIWRGIWAAEDVERKSERSRIISPATQQAVESSVAEMEEATFGRGQWFDIRDDNPATVQTRQMLQKDFDKTHIRQAISEALLNAAVFGSGVGEIIIDEVLEQKPASQPVMDGQLLAYGVQTEERVVVKLRPVLPQNFLIDPVATNVNDALGVIIEEYVSEHTVLQAQEKGYYRDVLVTTQEADDDLEPDQLKTVFNEDKIKLTKYYGLIPTHVLEDDEDAESPSEGDGYYTEAVIVIANDSIVLKAEKSPYMMQDRPVVAFSWDPVPGRFWGRGICEKGYNSQKALDAELRARIDALALTVHPAVAMDATRIPRGFKPELKPGKIFLTHGAPSEVIYPFKIGQVDQIQFAQASALQNMIQQATGAVDSAGIAGTINGEATAAGISMSLGAIIKRHKRTLINFQDSFLVPFVKKAAWRYMQFDPERYPANDYDFQATSTLGIIAREYEVSQLTQLLQTMKPDTPIYSALIQAIIDNMGLNNREQLLTQLQQASQPTPEQQQAQKAQMQREQAMFEADMAFKNAQTTAYQKQAQEFDARASKYAIEAQLEPQRLRLEQQEIASKYAQPGVGDDIEFERRMRIMDMALKKQAMDQEQRRKNLGVQMAMRNQSSPMGGLKMEQ